MSLEKKEVKYKNDDPVNVHRVDGDAWERYFRSKPKRLSDWESIMFWEMG
jgi:hypothetical protein